MAVRYFSGAEGVSPGPEDFAWAGESCRGRGVFRWRGVTSAGSQMILVTVLENGWSEDELAAKLERVLDLNARRNGLESQLVGILAEAIQAVNER